MIVDVRERNNVRVVQHNTENVQSVRCQYALLFLINFKTFLLHGVYKGYSQGPNSKPSIGHLRWKYARIRVAHWVELQEALPKREIGDPALKKKGIASVEKTNQLLTVVKFKKVP